MSKILISLYFLATLPLHGRPPEPVETLIHTQTGLKATWQKEEAMRQASSELVRKLLRQPLTVANAVRIAILSNRDLQATFEEVGIAQANVREALTVPNPSINFDVQFPAGPDIVNRYGWLIGQEFVQLLMMPLKKRISEQALEAAALRVAEEILRLVAEVKKAYFTLQADQQLLAYLRVIQEINAASLEFAQKQYEVGNNTDLALLQYQDAYNEGRLEIANAESRCEQHREDLNMLLGLWGKQTNWKIQGDLPPALNENFSNKQLESLAVAQRPDLRAAHYKVVSLTSALDLTRIFRWLPILDFGFSGERDNDATLNMGPAFQVELPLFNQGQFRIERAEAELRRASAGFEALAIRIRTDVRKFNNRLQVQFAKVRFYRMEVFPNRDKIVSQSMAQYHAMQISPYTLFLTRTRQIRAQYDFICELRDYWLTRAELERIVGGTLTLPQSQTTVFAKTPSKSRTKSR